ncbi:MAG: NADH:flavin oxidoreductase [Lachnospiraceae bacterium]|nr:NADH:flavin oxidoreductase [Lachnospiraceae bacterium]
MSYTSESIQIGSLTLNGRIVMPPIATYQCDDDGFVTDAVCSYYRDRAKNPHVSMIITEHNYIDLGGKAKLHQMAISDDACIPGLKKLVEAIHEGGAKAFSQLNHAGSAAFREVIGKTPVSASEVILPTTPQLGDAQAPAALTVTEIAELTEKFAEAAGRAKAAGYDGVEIHSAHSYLLNQFYSPLTNHRNDQYGGTLENRLRFHREVIRAVRKTVGDDYPISVRLGGCDYAEGGSTIEDSVAAAKILAAEGIDMLNISGGMNRYLIKGHNEPGYFRAMTEAIRKEVQIPVMLTGGVKKLADAEMLLEEGAADLIGVGRPLLAKADWEM